MDIEGPALRAIVQAARKQIRSRMRSLRAAVPAPSRARRDASIIERLRTLPEIHAARRVALFVPMESKGEIDLRPFDAELRGRGCDVLYPRLTEIVRTEAGPPELAGELVFASPDELVESGAGFLEPPSTARPASAGEVDVVVVPALAVAATGHRLGYGAGFYDRVLPAYCPPAVAVVVAYDFQLLGELPVEEWDFACDVVVTDERIVRVSQPPSS